MRRRLVVAIVLWSAAGVAAGEEPIDYSRQVKPLLARRCYACHGALKQKSGLRLDTAAALRQGGDGGPSIEPGKSGESLLIDAVTGANGVSRMPPEAEGTLLSPEEIALLRRWIDEGASAPADEQPQADPRSHWAFQRIERPAVPLVKNVEWVGNPIDAFIAAEQEQRGLTAAGLAEKSALLRRVSLDLTGLPPTREELHAFLNDQSPDAYERVVDRLLDSPHYGERWARHWMDVWRYSDWYGRRAVPDVWNSAPQIWRWRDWIVESLNRDKGYDRMVMEMLAADEIAPEDDSAALATGYIIRNWYALNAHQWMKDTVEHTAKAFLGLTLNCAHCHDHKYDPISQEEYFRYRAFFEPVQIRQDRLPGQADCGPFQKYEYTVLRKVMTLGAVRIFDENLAAETFMYRQGDERARFEGKPPVAPGAPAFLGGEALSITPVSLPPKAYYPGLKPFIREAETEARRKALEQAHGALVSEQQRLVAALERLAEIEAQQFAALKSAPAGGTIPAPQDPRWLDRKIAIETEVRAANHAVSLASAHLATEQALGESLAARIAADRARFESGSAGAAPQAAQAAATAASLAERNASLRLAEEKQVTARHAVTLARLKAEALPAGAEKDKAAAALQTCEQQWTAAVKAVEDARNALSVASSEYTPLSPVYPSKSTGRRKALAEWIARRENPLTARVAVNHIWGCHFGRPLVESVSDFGVNGKRPTHPQLLDWLAVELMDPYASTSPGPAGAGPTVSGSLPSKGANRGDSPSQTSGGEGGWRMKPLHRLIVTSHAYRQGSAIGPGAETNVALDPDNRFLWRFTPRRAEAETVRDSLLFAAGQLDPALGGEPAGNADELASRRRSLYFSVHPEDGGHPKFLELFDAPDPCDCYRRSESLIPQQALALANSQLTLNLSRKLARELYHESQRANQAESESAFITAAFERILSRAPTAAERNLCVEFLGRQAELFRKQESGASSAAAQGAVVPSNEPQIRASESLVHSLFNHNDFITIR